MSENINNEPDLNVRLQLSKIQNDINNEANYISQEDEEYEKSIEQLKMTFKIFLPLYARVMGRFLMKKLLTAYF